jgi:hypothetical protein
VITDFLDHRNLNPVVQKSKMQFNLDFKSQPKAWGLVALGLLKVEMKMDPKASGISEPRDSPFSC